MEEQVIKEEGKNLVEVPFKVKDIIYTVYADESDWADARVCIDAYEIKSILMNQDGTFEIKTTSEAYWKGTLECLKSDKFTDISKAIKEADKLIKKYSARKKAYEDFK